ncbi:MAG: mechanosensitive ion channel family protein [Waddliaceae bacterium]
MNILFFLENISDIIWIQPLVILLIAAVSQVSVQKVFYRIEKAKTTPKWVRTLSLVLFPLGVYLIWGYAILLALETLVEIADVGISFEWMAKARHIYALVMGSCIFFRWKTAYEKTLLNDPGRKGSSNSQEKALIVVSSKVLSVFVFTVAGLIVLDIIKIPLTGLLAFGGIGGAAIGFAAKDVVANYFGGLMIHINRPFALGEWILSPNKNFEGVVEEIGWYMTRIRTFTRRPTYIPNALFIDSIIENPGRMYHRRIKETIGIRYQDAGKVKSIVEGIESMLRNHPDIDQNQALFVHFFGFGSYSLNIEVYCYTKTTNWGEWRGIQQNIFLDIIQLIESHKAELALPTSSIHLRESAKPVAPQHLNQGISVETSVVS